MSAKIYLKRDMGKIPVLGLFLIRGDSSDNRNTDIRKRRMGKRGTI